ncbi:MAG: group II intron reverse transcriptase/maturase, partial [Candidatus Electrothrix sp. MAN1_4]|nr:group II intron reverse transcriptase/maturase [Candidatus Electrothrix sp. MAN1_4]
IIRFSRFQREKNKRFDFLGFEYRWGKDRNRKPLVKLRTSRKKVASLQSCKEWCRKNRHLPLRVLMSKLNAKLCG